MRMQPLVVSDLTYGSSTRPCPLGLDDVLSPDEGYVMSHMEARFAMLGFFGVYGYASFVMLAAARPPGVTRVMLSANA
ncbi:uncharacterized protein F4812DRAFT_461812 [Daldinia caldariorum]|uniref:uncharacterized protein n=1 Tax=Daldinia caldariorum TaxID=326644 RepID=UPI002008831D|nr:uncharacterized protein F4812DRAFT_461812 [Daldinia caldariorum]KAI1465499.1 hypothetical protein F4812DRAFT_461812 [Daldinia caldariorum]